MTWCGIYGDNADFFGVLLLRAFSSESVNTTIHGCWTADARRLQSRMIRFRKEEMLLNFLVRYSLLVNRAAQRVC